MSESETPEKVEGKKGIKWGHWLVTLAVLSLYLGVMFGLPEAVYAHHFLAIVLGFLMSATLGISLVAFVGIVGTMVTLYAVREMNPDLEELLDMVEESTADLRHPATWVRFALVLVGYTIFCVAGGYVGLGILVWLSMSIAKLVMWATGIGAGVARDALARQAEVKERMDALRAMVMAHNPNIPSA